MRDPAVCPRDLGGLSPVSGTAFPYSRRLYRDGVPCQLYLPVDLLLLAALLGCISPVAGDVKLQYDGVVHHPVNRRGSGHRERLGSFLVAGMRPTPYLKTSCLIRLSEILRCYRVGCFVDTREKRLTCHVE